MNTQYIIIGCGISGLYTAYNILLENPNANVTLFEKNKYIGGRIKSASLQGTIIPTGAGIARKAKDVLLIDLLDKFNLKYNEGVAQSIQLGHEEINIMEIVNKLRKNYLLNPVHEKFSIFAKKYMTVKEYELFVTNTGYSDFNNTDAYDLLFNYGIEDTSNGWATVYVPWNDLINNLIKFIKDRGAKIKLGYTVQSIKNNEIRYYNSNSKVKNNANNSTNNATFSIDSNTKIVIATTVSHLQKLLPSHKIYKNIAATNFMRVYGVFSKTSRIHIANKIPKVTILNKPLQEIIPINPEKGVYMIVYNDSESATKLYNEISKLNNTSTSITSNDVGEKTPQYNDKCVKYLEELLSTTLVLPQENVKLDKIVIYYWNEGTHYFKPLHKKYNDRIEFIKEAQHPCDNIFVVGEVVAQHQGWSEGALESVQNILRYL